MDTPYDEYYKTENLFGAPYPELLELYAEIPDKGKLLDVGCGQGRDAIALARLGFEVTGIDHSAVGIAQLNRIAEQEDLPLIGVVADIYAYTDFEPFNFILMDSMFHFGKKERAQEESFLRSVFLEAAPGTRITICLQNTGEKVTILNAVISAVGAIEEVSRRNLVYRYEDKESGHASETEYEMVHLCKRAS